KLAGAFFVEELQALAHARRSIAGSSRLASGAAGIAGRSSSLVDHAVKDVPFHPGAYPIAPALAGEPPPGVEVGGLVAHPARQRAVAGREGRERELEQHALPPRIRQPETGAQRLGQPMSGDQAVPGGQRAWSEGGITQQEAAD